MEFPVLLAGMTMGLSLIVAIGAQNAFVLRQGLRDEHVFAVCLTCAVSDAALIVLGVTSFARIATLLPWLDPVMRYGGAVFLIVYGAKSLRSALRSTEALKSEGATAKGGLVGTAAGLPGDHMAEPACLSRYGRPPRHGVDPVSRRGDLLRRRRRRRVVPLLLRPRLWRGVAQAGIRHGHPPGGRWKEPSPWSCGRSR